jgi:hypothetical protein
MVFPSPHTRQARASSPRSTSTATCTRCLLRTSCLHSTPPPVRWHAPCTCGFWSRRKRLARTDADAFSVSSLSLLSFAHDLTRRSSVPSGAAHSAGTLDHVAQAGALLERATQLSTHNHQLTLVLMRAHAILGVLAPSPSPSLSVCLCVSLRFSLYVCVSFFFPSITCLHCARPSLSGRFDCLDTGRSGFVCSSSVIKRQSLLRCACISCWLGLVLSFSHTGVSFCRALSPSVQATL